MSKLEKLRAKQWKLAEDMETASLQEFMLLTHEFQKITMSIYYAEQAELGISRSKAKQIMHDLFKQHNLELPVKG